MPEVELFINDLIDILFQQEYFGFEEDAQKYAFKIVDFIENAIFTFPPKIAPIQLQKLGSNYIFYKPNQNTTWFIFYELSQNKYLITKIINNHSLEAKWL